MLDFIDNVISTVSTIFFIIVAVVVIFFIWLMVKSKIVQDEAEEKRKQEQAIEAQRQKIQEQMHQKYWDKLPDRYDNLPTSVIDKASDLLYEMHQTDTSDWGRCLELKESGINIGSYTSRFCDAEEKLELLLQRYGKDSDIHYYELDIRYIIDVLNAI